MADFSRPAPRVIVPGEAPFPAPLILLATLLGGLPAGGLLVALNWDRLYRPDRQRRTLIGVSLGFLLGVGLLAIAYAATRHPAVIGLGVALNALAGLGLVRGQAAAYADWVGRYGRPTRAGIHLPGVLVPLGVVVFVEACLLYPLIVLVVLPEVTRLLPDRVYESEGLRLAYARTWEALDTGGDAACRQPDTTCLLALRAESGRTIVDVARVTAAAPVDADAVAAELWTAASIEPGAALIGQDRLLLAGREAARLAYRLPNPSEAVSVSTLTLWRLILPVGEGYLRITIATADPDQLDDGLIAAGQGPVGRLLAGLRVE